MFIGGPGKMKTPNMEDVLDKVVIDAMALAEGTYAHLAAYGDDVPEYLSRAPEQPGQRDEDGELRKVARAHIPGTACHLDILEEPGGWTVKVLDSEGGVLYRCGPGDFDLSSAAAAVPVPGPPTE